MKYLLIRFQKYFENKVILNSESKSGSAYFELTELSSLKQSICTTAALTFQSTSLIGSQ